MIRELYNFQTDQNGNKIWKNLQGLWHNENGPAVIWHDGGRSWFINGKNHRENGPSNIENGGNAWFIQNHQII